MHQNKRIIMWLHEQFGEGNENVKIIVDALKKQIPKKPKEKFVEVEIYNSGGFTRKEARKICPACKAGLSHEHFCYGCGQKLDWEGGE